MRGITYIMRRESPRYFSIEAVFRTINKELERNGVDTHRVCLPGDGVSVRTLMRNLWHAFRIRSRVVHITGDVHYVAPVIRGPVILTIHDVGSALRGGCMNRFFIKLFWFWIPALCVRRITVISEFSARELVRLVPFARHKVRVIPNPLPECSPSEPYDFCEASPLVLLVGTKENKNLPRIVQALTGLSCRLLIVGHLTPHQRSMLDNSGLVYRNETDLPPQAMAEVYRKCDLLCFASTYEGFGLPIIEAQASGRPVITSCVASMPEVAGKGALLVDPHNPQAIRDAFLRLVQDADLRNRLIAEGLENVKRFAPERVAGAYLSLYRELARV